MKLEPLLNNKINSIIEQYSSGYIQESLESIEILIKEHPKESLLHNISGVIFKATGQLELAIQSFKKAIAIKPDFADAHYNLGLTFQELNQFDNAVKSYEMSLSIHSNYAKAHNNLGIIYKELGKMNDAVKSYNKALSIDPDYAEVHNNLGNTLTELGKLDEALKCYQQALIIYPDYLEVHNNLGNIFFELGKFDEAVKFYQKAIALEPDYAEAHNNLATSLNELGQSDKAVMHYESAININPEHAEAHNNLGNILQNSGDLFKAINFYMTAITIDPNFEDAYYNLGITNYLLGQTEEAINSYKQLLVINPDYADAHNNLSIIYQELGQSDEAFNGYVHALAIEPDNTHFHFNLSSLKQYKEADTQFIHMQKLLSNRKLDQSDQIRLSFALAKAYDDLGMKEDLFKILNKANQLRKAELNYSIKRDLNKHSISKKLFKSVISITPSYKPLTVRPIFIVGMPRSGTTLVEQIISSHHKVHGEGELPTLDNLITPIFNDYLVNNNPLTDKDFLSVRYGYISNHLSNFSSSEKIITDKMPTNFENIGFILKSFPEAKIVHLKRDAMAVCWSIYQRSFSNKDLGFPYNMEDLAQFYNSYTKLMAFWHELFPSQIYDMSYENLTTNQEEETKKLLEYCELDWDDSCLNFYTNKKSAKTASSLQVKEKMYQGSSEAWKKYEQQLKPLINTLGYYQEKI